MLGFRLANFLVQTANLMLFIKLKNSYQLNSTINIVPGFKLHENLSLEKLISIYNLQMASLMSEIKNPFLKDYSTTSLLKKNYGVLLIQSQVKQNKQNFKLQYKKQPQLYKQNISNSSSISNPFSNKSIDAYELLHKKRDPHNQKNSQVRYLTQNKSMFGSIQKNMFYKGLEDLGTKQMMKNEMERQVRQHLKYYGPDSLRYQYVPMEYSAPTYTQEKPNLNTVVNRDSFKRVDSKKNIETPKWKSNITSQYFGYDGVKEKKDDDDFPIQKQKAQCFKGLLKDTPDKGKRHSYYQKINNIPEDRNQDLQTAHHIKINLISPQQQFLTITQHRTSPHKRLSIENFSPNFHPQSSASSGYGYSSDMYESGANFITKFGKKKAGPLDTDDLDDEKNQSDQFDLDQFEDIDKKSGLNLYPDTLEHNNKIYYQIPL